MCDRETKKGKRDRKLGRGTANRKTYTPIARPSKVLQGLIDEREEYRNAKRFSSALITKGHVDYDFWQNRWKEWTTRLEEIEYLINNHTEDNE